MPVQRFIVNGEPVEVDVPDEVRLLWVLRDLLGITGPKYGCALGVCQACTSHINGQPFNPCAVPVGQLRPDDEILTIEGLAATVDDDLHPVQQAWLDHDVAQCGFCQPGQIMAAVALIEEAHAAGRAITDDDLDGIRNVCRCGTYPRIRDAIRDAAGALVERGSWSTGAAAGSVAAAGPAAGADEPAASVTAASDASPAATTGRLPATGGSGQALPAAAVATAAAVAIRQATKPRDL